jgi:hypothetical protein
LEAVEEAWEISEAEGGVALSADLATEDFHF